MDLKREGYWEEHYEEELKNFEDNGDEGDVWFGESLTKRIVSKILLRIAGSDLNGESKISLIDVGCGNAFLLCSLLERLSEHPNSKEILDKIELIGIDYAEKSIELSKKIANSKELSGRMKLSQCDFLDRTGLVTVTDHKKFDVIIDKGTFDAICLLTDDISSVRTRYVQSIYSIVKSGSVFILASCNHTEDELLTLFYDSPMKHEVLERIETPKFKFGGSEGSQVCCIVIKFD